MYPISRLKLKFGPQEDFNLLVSDPAVTIFIGPNNAGKSMALLELYNEFRHGPGAIDAKIIDSVEYAAHSPEVGQELVRRALRADGISAEISATEQFNILRDGRTMVANLENMEMVALNPLHPNHRMLFLQNDLLMMSGSGRLGLTQKRAADSYRHPKNTLSRIFFNDGLRAKLRAALFSAFGRYFVIDPSSSPGQLIPRYSKNPPESIALEKSLSVEAQDFYEAAELVDEASDGVKAFTGMLLELYAGDPRILIIDEPEAFLHPSLARMLGHEIAKPSMTNAAQKNVFIATHSASFLMGCVQAASAINIIRLTYVGGVPKANLLSSEAVRPLFRNPLLRSANAIEALFYDCVVVVEADSDRAFYDEINHRLNSFDDPRGIRNCLFMRAQNKQTVADIIGPLRSLGVPVAGIVDIDIYKEGGSVWGKLISSIKIPEVSRSGTETIRAKLKEKFDAAGKNPKREGGVSVLSKTDRESAENLFDMLAAYGLFVVRRGELESWLPHVSNKSDKASWLVDTFEKLGEDVSDRAYVRPDQGDVWDFIGEIGHWCRNPGRKGV